MGSGFVSNGLSSSQDSPQVRRNVQEDSPRLVQTLFNLRVRVAMFVNPANYWSSLRGYFGRPWTVFQWRLVQLATGCGIHDQSRHPNLVARLRVLTEANVGSAFFKFLQNATQEVVIVEDLPEFQD